MIIIIIPMIGRVPVKILMIIVMIDILKFIFLEVSAVLFGRDCFTRFSVKIITIIDDHLRLGLSGWREVAISENRINRRVRELEKR